MLKHSYTTRPIALFCSIIHVIYFRPENRGTKAQERKDDQCQWFLKFFYFACVQCWKGQTRLYANNTTFRPTNVCVDTHSHQQTESHSQAYSYPTHSHGHTNTWWASHTHMHVAYKSYHTYIHIYFKEAFTAFKPVLSSFAFCQRSVTHNVTNYVYEIILYIFLDFPHLSYNWRVSNFFLEEGFGSGKFIIIKKGPPLAAHYCQKGKMYSVCCCGVQPYLLRWWFLHGTLVCAPREETVESPPWIMHH